MSIAQDISPDSTRSAASSIGPSANKISSHTSHGDSVMKETDIAYCAGLFDGESCIRIKKSKAYRCQGRATPGYHACVMIHMVEESAIKFVAELLGGWYYLEKAIAAQGRPLYKWSASNLKAEVILRKLLPFLRVKRQQAELVLQLRDLQKDGKRHRTKIVGYRDFPNQHGTVRRVPNLAFSDEYVAECERLYLACKRLNRVGLAALEP